MSGGQFVSPHGLLRLEDDALKSELHDRASKSDCAESLLLLDALLVSTSTEFQSARVKRIGGLAVKLSKDVEGSREEKSLLKRVILCLFLGCASAGNTTHLLASLARVLDALCDEEVKDALRKEWGTSDCRWQQFGA